VPALSSIAVPTLVIHRTADPMFPREHGTALAEEIRGRGCCRRVETAAARLRGADGSYRFENRFRNLVAAVLVALAGMRSGLFLLLFDGLADPAIVARLSAEAEEAG
jgi:hypothetical protein